MTYDDYEDECLEIYNEMRSEYNACAMEAEEDARRMEEEEK